MKVLKVGSLKLPGTFSITFIFWLIVDTEVDPCVQIHAILGWVGGGFHLLGCSFNEFKMILKIFRFVVKSRTPGF